MKDNIVKKIVQHIERTSKGSIKYQNEGFGIFDIIFKDHQDTSIVKMIDCSDFIWYQLFTYSLVVIGFFLPKETMPYFATAFGCSLYFTIKRTNELSRELDKNYSTYYRAIIHEYSDRYDFSLDNNVLTYQKKQN